jgi:hypothetical protein
VIQSLSESGVGKMEESGGTEMSCAEGRGSGATSLAFTLELSVSRLEIRPHNFWTVDRNGMSPAMRHHWIDGLLKGRCDGVELYYSIRL